MAKPTTTPIIIDLLRCISTKDLKAKGLLNREGAFEGEITWNDSLTKELTSSVGIEINTRSDKPFIRLYYSAGAKNLNYRVDLVKVISNLGRGWNWYLNCPITGKRCSKLYLNEDHFVSRLALRKEGCVYSSELVPKSVRSENLDYKRVQKLIAVVLCGQKKYSKSHYRGKETKMQIRIKKAGEKLKSMGYLNLVH